MGNNGKRLAQLHKKLAQLHSRIAVIRAEHTKEIFTSTAYDSLPYNDRPRLRDADLTIALSHDNEYTILTDEITDIESEQIELGDDFVGGLS